MHTRSLASEVMDDPALPDETLTEVYRLMSRIHRFLGNHRAVLQAIRRDPHPVRKVLDLGCGDGTLLREIRQKLAADVLGVDLRPPKCAADVPILRADAVREPLPESDVAVALCLIHHLSDTELTDLIRNVGRSCRRFIIVDLVRHRVPRQLFRMGIYPWVNPVTAIDGIRSIERAFTAEELGMLVRGALRGSPARVRHRVSPFNIRQVVEIVY